MTDLCQYLTPPRVAQAFLAWAGVQDTDIVLDPAAGEGALIPRRPGVLAIEKDPELLDELRYWRPDAQVVQADFLTLEPFLRANVVILNPPYADDGEGKFIRRALLWAPRCCALVRTLALHGKARYELCWRYVRPTRIAILTHRPRFLGPGGAATPHTPEADYMVIECVMRPKPTDLKENLVLPTLQWVDWH